MFLPIFAGFVIGFMCFTAVLLKLATTLLSDDSRKVA
jgi:hypothetical protein